MKFSGVKLARWGVEHPSSQCLALVPPAKTFMIFGCKLVPKCFLHPTLPKAGFFHLLKHSSSPLRRASIAKVLCITHIDCRMCFHTKVMAMTDALYCRQTIRWDNDWRRLRFARSNRAAALDVKKRFHMAAVGMFMCESYNALEKSFDDSRLRRCLWVGQKS